MTLQSAPDFRLLGVRIDNMPMRQALAEIVSTAASEGTPPCQMAFVNAHCLNVAARDRRYREVLNGARRVFADGVGVRVGARALGVRVRENVNGTDLFPRLCHALEAVDVGVFLLGASPRAVQGTADWIMHAHPRLRLAGVHHGFFSRGESDAVADEIRRSGAKLLLVAMGVPMQELWIDAHLRRAGVRVALGVGALFDFYSASVPRAPGWMRAHALEWVWRLGLEPRRMWRRYVLGNPRFLLRVAGQALTRRFQHEG
ncbi:MAG: WecB/TagA/CpsF family glycosyltransferase [Proteobacteria bacterium]|nr:WecB/TagA/CpsF family glycosyltransferase [Pseudomonadota bacterium]